MLAERPQVPIRDKNTRLLWTKLQDGDRVASSISSSKGIRNHPPSHPFPSTEFGKFMSSFACGTGSPCPCGCRARLLKEKDDTYYLNITNQFKTEKEMKMNEIYEAPMLEILNVCVEAGFAESVGAGESNGEDAPF